MEYYIGFYIPDYFLLLFTICLLVSVPVLCFFAKRHPNPHFRPRKVEVLMVALFLLLASGTASWVTSKMLHSHIDPAKMAEQVNESQEQAFRGSILGGNGSVENNQAQSSGGGNANLPENVPREFREVVNEQ